MENRFKALSINMLFYFFCCVCLLYAEQTNHVLDCMKIFSVINTILHLIFLSASYNYSDMKFKLLKVNNCKCHVKILSRIHAQFCNVQIMYTNTHAIFN